MLDPVDGDVVAEDGVDDLVQLVRVVDRRVKGQLLQQHIHPKECPYFFVLSMGLFGQIGLPGPWDP